LAALELRPNCLLTRYPILFLSGKRSLFRFFEHWNDIPVFLREHGYDVFVIEYGNSGDALQNLLSIMDHLERPCHIIADASQADTLNRFANYRHSNAASFTLIQNSRRSTQTDKKTVSVDDLKPTASAIEVFKIDPIVKKGLFSEIRFEWILIQIINLMSGALLSAHNLFFLRQHHIDPVETGDFIIPDGWPIEDRILDLAILLAERDAQWCD
jgi:hypothetical protein